MSGSSTELGIPDPAYKLDGYQITQVFSELTSELEPLSDSVEIWKRLISLQPKDLLVCGLATPVFKVAARGALPVYELEFDTDFGRVPVPPGIVWGPQHFVIDRRFIPLRVEDAVLLGAVAAEVDIEVGGELDKAAFFRLIHSVTKAGARIEVAETVGDLFELRAVSADKPELTVNPYPYQELGIQWLIHTWELRLGGILGDEMGLGKTLQAIGLISHVMKHVDKPSILIVAPATLVQNWSSEIRRFAVGIVAQLHVGRDRRLDPRVFNEHQLIVTTYDTLRVDFGLFSKRKWDLVICDEAQALKNQSSIRSSQIAELQATSKILVTGTPVENSPSDLTTLVDIAVPGLMGHIGNLDTREVDDLRFARMIGQICSPAVLRREVRDVAQDLPELIVQDEPLAPSDSFIDFYEEIRTLAKVQGILPTITRLQQLCCSPALIGPEGSAVHDVKMARTLEICSEIFQYSKEKVIIFTTFVGSIDLLAQRIATAFGPEQVRTLDGRLLPERRQLLVDEFNGDKGPRFLVINPRAGGSGLNLQGANHVIHFNPQWNPQLERQATARAYRRGQERPVMVHNLYYAGTVEEVIREKLELKIDLAEASLEESVVSNDAAFQEKVLNMSLRVVR